jgi:hypothetical protein
MLEEELTSGAVVAPRCLGHALELRQLQIGRFLTEHLGGLIMRRENRRFLGDRSI